MQSSLLIILRLFFEISAALTCLQLHTWTPTAALGIPNYSGDNNCTGDPTCAFVSLGNGGFITVEFIDNFLTGSGNADLDLWIFEIGPAVESTLVEVSKDGITFFSVGQVGGSTAGIDLDAFGFGTSDLFKYVRLTDVFNDDLGIGITAGADIDAVGAISSVAAAVPEPSNLLLIAAGLTVLWIRRKLLGEIKK